MNVIPLLPIKLVLNFFFRLFNCFAFSGGERFNEESEEGDLEEGDSEEGSPPTWEMFVPLGDSKPACPATFFSFPVLWHSILKEVDDAHVCCPFNWR